MGQPLLRPRPSGSPRIVESTAIQARVWQHFAGVGPLALSTRLDKTLGEDPPGGATAAA